jgi:hypothetical protein
MTKKTYQIDLRGYDITEYLKNPVVVWSFDWVEPIGRATIADDKLSAEVTFLDELTYTHYTHAITVKTGSWTLELLPAYVEDEGVRELVGLSLSPKKS